jgi:hypothetical protein
MDIRRDEISPIFWAPGLCLFLVLQACSSGTVSPPASENSTVYKILPTVRNISVTYNYPTWTGLASVTEHRGGDLRAVEATVAKLMIQSDRPLGGAHVVLGSGELIGLEAIADNKATASIPIDKNGTYYIAITDHGELVRLTDVYRIEARKPGRPKVTINKPGRDITVTSIEEVTVAVSAESEYPLQEVDLHYSVNGQPEKIISMLRQKGAKQMEASTLLLLEERKLVPGDIISFHATARDGKNSTETGILFIQAVPFEFGHPPQTGGGGGGQDQAEQISERQKDIIAATFDQLRDDTRARASAAENGKSLAEAQANLRDQVQSIANRIVGIQPDGSDTAFQQLAKEMEAAAKLMSPASDKLRELSFQKALPAEQQALPHLLRAESTMRQIQGEIGSRGGGGGDGRDLASLFDLDLGNDKNQYHTNAAPPAPRPATPAHGPARPTPSDVDFLEASLKRLRTGNLAYNVPQKMKTGETARVTARIAVASLPVSELTKDFPASQRSTIAPTKISTKMKMTLSGPDFTITPLSPPEQFVDNESATQWQWEVKPNKHGTLEIRLAAIAEMNEFSKEFTTVDRNITVQVDIADQLAEFWTGNWQWSMATLTAVCGVFWKWLQSRKKT